MQDYIGHGGASAFSLWVPVIASIVSVLLNIAFSVFIAPRVLRKSNAREEMRKICAEYLKYLADIVSFESFEGVPTRIRELSLEVKLMFKPEKVPDGLARAMEEIFTMAKDRKAIDPQQVTVWEQNFRNKVRDLEIEMAKHCGTL